MASINHATVSLRFNGDDLDPEELSRRLGATPTRAAAKGTTWLTPTGTERVARTGFWQLKGERHSPDDLTDQISRLFEQLTSDHATWRELSERFRGNLFAGLFLAESNEGLTIPPELAREIGARGLELGLDIYGPSEE